MSNNDIIIDNPRILSTQSFTYFYLLKAFIFKLLKSKTIWLIILTSIVELIWLFTQHIGYGSDSTTYFILANYLVNKSGGGGVLFLRTPGYPILMILGGVPFFNSFLGLIIIQAIMAILIPVLIYKTLLLIVPHRAFLGALLSILTLLPVVYSKAIMPDHAFIFTLTLLVYLMAIYQQTKKPIHLYCLGACLIFLTLLRPSANITFLIIFPFCLLVSPKNYKHLLASYLIFVIVNAAWFFWVRLEISPNVFGNISISNKIKQNLFFHIYTRNNDQINYINPANGPASKQLQEYLIKYTQHPENWESSQPSSLFSKYKSNPGNLIEAVYHHPNPNYYQYINNAILYNRQAGDNSIVSPLILMSKVAWESIAAKPTLLSSFIWKNTLGSGTSFAGQMLFYQIYVAANASLKQGNVFKASNGPASKQLIEDIRDYAYDHPESYETTPFYMQYKGNPDQLIEDKFLKAPDLNTHWYMWAVMDNIYTPLEAPGHFLSAALEGIYLYPPIYAVFIENLNSFFFSLSTTSSSGKRTSMFTTAGMPYWWEDGSLPESYKGELKSGMRLYDTSSWMQSKAWVYWGYVWLFLKPLLFLTILVTFLFSIGSKYFSFLLTLMGLLIYQGLTASIFAESAPRYIDHILLLTLETAIISISIALSRQGVKRV